jgi:hypothetical protein
MIADIIRQSRRKRLKAKNLKQINANIEQSMVEHDGMLDTLRRSLFQNWGGTAEFYTKYAEAEKRIHEGIQRRTSGRIV